jgi:hypothetical protein
VQRDLDELEAAKDSMMRVIAANPSAPGWLVPWTYAKLGEIAALENDKTEAG